MRKFAASTPGQFTNNLGMLYKRNQGENAWNNKITDQKLNLIVSYLLEVRRNRYTHSANTPPTIGKIRDARTRLLDGNAQLPPPESATISWSNAEFTITCNHGDDALFVRELVYACVANRYGLLDENWLSRFRDVERQYRILQALLYELEYNIRVIQYHASLLFEGFAILDGRMPPHFRTHLATSLLNRDNNLNINFAPQLLAPFLGAYL